MTDNFTNIGYTKRTADEIKKDLQNFMISTNPSFRKNSADVQNNLLDTGTPLIQELENICGDMANGYAPTYANRFMWELLAQSLGIQYKSEIKSSATLLFKGKENDYIPAGTTTNGNFSTTQSLILGSTGEGYVLAYSDTKDTFEANTINTITTTIGDGITVTNPSESIPYKEQTTAEELKIAGQRKLRNARISNNDYCTAQLLQLDGIQPRLIGYKIRETGTSNSIECVIGGGDVKEVANILFNSFLVPSRFVSQPSNSETNRTVSQDITFYNSKFTVKWTLPKALNLQVNLSLKIQNAIINNVNFTSLLNTQLANELNNRNVGTPLNKATLNDIVYGIIAELGIDKYKISTLEWTLKDGSGNALDFNENDFLEAIEFDVYTNLSSLDVVIYAI